jgi:hypothetical protein
VRTHIRRTLVAALLGAAALAGADRAAAQVVEDRDSEANPAAAVFRATLYGVGTGLVLGGAYALVADDANTGEILRWGTAAGAAGGLLVGLLYVATRSEPEGSADEIRDDVGLLQVRDGSLALSPMGLLAGTPRDTPRGVTRPLDFNLVAVRH